MWRSVADARARGGGGATCVADAGQFWKMHDLNFASQDRLDAATLRRRVLGLGVPAAAFDRCLTTDGAACVDADQARGQALQVTGTPTFFVERRQADGRGKVVKRFAGGLPVDQFRAVLDGALKTLAAGGTK